MPPSAPRLARDRHRVAFGPTRAAPDTVRRRAARHGRQRPARAPAGGAGRAGHLARRPAGHQPDQHPLPHRLHRLGGPAVRAARRSAVLLTDGRYRHPGGRAAGCRRASTPGSRSPGRRTRRERARQSWRPPAPSGAWAWRRPTSAGPASGRSPTDWFPGVGAGPHRRSGRGLAPGQGPRRAGPPGGGGRASPTRPSTGCDPSWLRASPRRPSAGPSTSRCAAWAPAGPSFETIVASGPNAAKPHHRPGSRLIRPGEPVVLDFGARFDGYCSDMTRTVWVGQVADPELRRAVDVVLASQAAGVAAVGPGVACAEVDRACRQVIAGRRAGRSVRARHRSRGRPRHPRGAVGGGDARPIHWRSAMSSPSSRACTSPVWAASASRTPSW